MSEVAMRYTVSIQKQCTMGCGFGWFVFPQSCHLAWLDIQEMWNTPVYPAVIPAVIGLETISVVLVH